MFMMFYRCKLYHLREHPDNFHIFSNNEKLTIIWLIIPVAMNNNIFILSFLWGFISVR